MIADAVKKFIFRQNRRAPYMLVSRPYLSFTIFLCLSVPLVAIALSAFVLLLSSLEYLAQYVLDRLGYTLTITDEIRKTVLTFSGAITVGCLALFGVHRQNLSAERRHRVDSSLALRKEIFLQVAEAASTQYQYLLSFASPDVTESERKEMVEKIGAAFFRLQVVAKQETIEAMLQANEAWTRAMFSIRALGSTPQRFEDCMDRLIKIQELAKPFLLKHWQYNSTVREEIESGFPDKISYESAMKAQYSRIEDLIREVKIANSNDNQVST